MLSGTDVDAAHENDGSTLLHAAAYDGCEDTVKLLMDSGCTIDKPDNDGSTALQYALMQHHTNILQLLLKEN